MAVPEMIDGGQIGRLEHRKITAQTCEKYGYRQWRNPETQQREEIAVYCDKNGKPVAQKIRTPDKQFAWRGRPKESTALYGQHLWSGGGKVLVVTEGELDCLSVYQVNGGWPVVSLKNGAKDALKSCQVSLEWLESFEKVVLCFDNDDAGKAAQVAVAELLSPGRAYIVELPLKDANEMIVAGRDEELRRCLFQAKQFRPDGVINGLDLWQELIDNPPHPGVPTPWDAINKTVAGWRRREIITILAGSSAGKSTFCKQVLVGLLEHGERVGIISLEEDNRETMLDLLSIYIGERLRHVDNLQALLKSNPKYFEDFRELCGDGNVMIYRHDGQSDLQNLLSKIRFLAKGCGCGYILLDNVTGITAKGKSTKEILDEFYTVAKDMVKELDIGLFAVSHLRKAGDKNSHESGAVVSTSDAYGSQLVNNFSHTEIALERNQQCPDTKDLTRIRILKLRYDGSKTGVAGVLRYDHQTGRLTDTDMADLPKSKSEDMTSGFDRDDSTDW